jgi:hypothetical protein
MLMAATSTHWDELFFHNIPWINEVCLLVLNVRSNHLWERDNLDAIGERGYEVRFSISVSAGIVGNIAVGPYLLPDR